MKHKYPGSQGVFCVSGLSIKNFKKRKKVYITNPSFSDTRKINKTILGSPNISGILFRQRSVMV